MYRKIYRNMRILCLLTLTITTVLIISAIYSVFESRIKDEIRAETEMLADIININPGVKESALKIGSRPEDRRITLIDKDGNVIYDSYTDGDEENHSDRIEIQEALRSGRGEAQRFSQTLKADVFYCALKLDDGDVLRISRVMQNNFTLFVQLIWPIIFMLVLLYILCVIIAVRLTDNIVKPLSTIDFNDDETIECEYDELKPFLSRIQGQQREIKHQMERVERQKSRLQAISENMSEGLIVLDKDENVLSVNESALSVFNADEQSVLNRHFIYLCRDVAVKELLKRTLGGEKGSIEFSVHNRHYHIFASPVFEAGQVSGAVILIFDISERYETEQIRREFSANVSHELKTPITTILGYSQIINKGIAKKEDIAGFAEKIERETARLIKLIDDIIKLSRLDDEENSNIQMQEIHLKSVAEECFERLAESADEKNVEMTITGDDSVIVGNGVQIFELVYNLCENAVKYNKNGGKVVVSIGKNKISVKDTGIGIPNEYRDRVFERFFRVDKSRSKSVNGTGLGLSIVKHIAKCHNAEIKLDSEPGKGTEIAVIFPEAAE